MEQLSFLSAGVTPPAPDDLEGLLCGPGQVVRQGDRARVSVVVAERWRADALLAELAAAGVSAELSDTEPGTLVVRTAFTAALHPLATRWAGPTKRAPDALLLDGARLRWWALAAGRADGLGYVLGLGPQDDATWQPLGAALARAGITGTLLGPRADGPAYRVTSARRLARLRELVGSAPEGVPPTAWPAVAPAR